MPIDLTPVPVGGDVRANTYTASDQLFPSIAVLADGDGAGPMTAGSYVVTWSSLNQDGSSWGVYGQRYSANGTVLGSEFHINTVTTHEQIYQNVAALNDGGFAVVWCSLFQDGSGFGIYGQRYDSTGAAVGSEFQVNTFTTFDQIYPSITALDDDGFVVVWTSSSNQDGSGGGIFGQKYDITGQEVGSEFQINSFTTGEQRFASVTALADGAFVVTWMSNAQDADGTTGVFGQQFTTSGTPVGGEFHVNTYLSSVQGYPQVSSLSDGGFVVAWMSYGQESNESYGIRGQRFSPAGVPVGDEFHVNTYTAGEQSFPSVTDLPDGGFVVGWISLGQDGGGWGAYAQRFDASGAPIGTEFRINQTTGGDQIMEAWAGRTTLAVTPDGHLIATWYGNQAGDYNVYATTFTLPSANTPPTLDATPVTVAENTAAITTLTAIDPDAGQTLTYAITGGADAAQFSINASTGALSFKAPRDFETPVDAGQNNVYEVTVQVSDGNGGTDTETLSVTVTDANDAPTITGPFGHLDIVTANFGSSAINIFLGNGFGSFSGSAIATPGSIHNAAPALSDFNEDGITDIASANYHSGDVSLLLSNGSGGFTSAIRSIGASTPAHLAVADLNADGHQDIVTANDTSHNVSILLGDGLGGFTASTTGLGGGLRPVSVAIGDVNSDGRLDIVTANQSGNNVSLLLGDGAGGFTASTLTTVGPSFSVALGDIDNDGDLDIVAANHTGNVVSVLRGNGTGAFTASTVGVGGGIAPQSIALGDINEDGNLDIVTANASSNNVSVLSGNGAGGFTAQTHAIGGGFNPWLATIGDVNADGNLDIVTANRATHDVSVLIGNGSGAFTASRIPAATTDPISVVLGPVVS